MSQPELIGQEKLWSLCSQAIDASSAEQTEVSIVGHDSGLTRFAQSMIHQNVAERNYEISIKVANGKRLGYASTNQLDTETIRKAVESAVKFSKSLPENPDFVSLPSAGDGYPEVKSFYASTASFGPEDRAAGVREIIETASNVAGATASGSFSSGVSEHAVVNSLGLRAYSSGTNASLIVVCQADDGVSYAESHSRDASAIDAAATAKEAALRCKENQNPAGIQPGEYDVVLLPYAAIDLVGMMGYMGFGALGLQEKRSFLTDKMGQKVMSECISIWDDGSDLRGFARSFDGEGVPKQRVDLIKDGIAAGVVYDSYTAFREGKTSTGHGTGGSGTWGPMPTNLYVSTGESSIEKLIEDMGDGLLITRFHYTNVLKERLSIVTGMTRDGTFRVQNGKVTGPVRNLRFTESLLRAFSNVEDVGKDLMISPGVCAPALRIKGFRFTGVTEF